MLFRWQVQSSPWVRQKTEPKTHTHVLCGLRKHKCPTLDMAQIDFISAAAGPILRAIFMLERASVYGHIRAMRCTPQNCIIHR